MQDNHISLVSVFLVLRHGQDSMHSIDIVSRHRQQDSLVLVSQAISLVCKTLFSFERSVETTQREVIYCCRNSDDLFSNLCY